MISAQVQLYVCNLHREREPFLVLSSRSCLSRLSDSAENAQKAAERNEKRAGKSESLEHWLPRNQIKSVSRYLTTHWQHCNGDKWHPLNLIVKLETNLSDHKPTASSGHRMEQEKHFG